MVSAAGTEARREPVIRDDRELEQRQAKLLVCQSMIAHARQTLPPDLFWKRTRIWMEEWDRLDEEIRTYFTDLPEGAEARSEAEANAAIQAELPTIAAKNTAAVLGSEGVRLEFRSRTGGDLIQTYELRGARAWAVLQMLAGTPPEPELTSPALDALKDRLDAAEFAITEARTFVDSLLLGEPFEGE
jgi:hypothetical protein